MRIDVVNAQATLPYVSYLTNHVNYRYTPAMTSKEISLTYLPTLLRDTHAFYVKYFIQSL